MAILGLKNVSGIGMLNRSLKTHWFFVVAAPSLQG